MKSWAKGIDRKIADAHRVVCPKCKAVAVVIETYFGGRRRLQYTCHPCDMSVGSHPDGKPLGTMADRPTREARMRAHAAFDALWQDGDMSRWQAYKWLRDEMGMTENEGHIGKFTVEQCEKLIAAVNDFDGVPDPDPTNGADGFDWTDF